LTKGELQMSETTQAGGIRGMRRRQAATTKLV
jgi:hypothetical protein